MSFSSRAFEIALQVQYVLERALPYLTLLALFLSFVLLLVVISLQRRVSRLLVGRNGSLEETLTVLSRDVKDLQRFRTGLEAYLKSVEERLRHSIQGLGMLRFNPFSGDGSGGNQSFAAAFLDENHNGVVLSSLYARDRAVVYGKPIANGASSYELTDEEKQAIAKAKESITARPASK